MNTNQHVLVLTIGVALLAIMYTRYHLNKRKALKRLLRIADFWNFADGDQRALDHYEEGGKLWRYYGFIPEDFGFRDWIDVQSAATRSLSRYIETMNGIFTEEQAAYLRLQERKQANIAAADEIIEMPDLSRAVVKLEGMLTVARENLAAFVESHRAPSFS
jgi:hypothetical protein